MAGGEGFEPPHTDPESAVLPLDDPPKTEPASAAGPKRFYQKEAPRGKRNGVSSDR